MTFVICCITNLLIVVIDYLCETSHLTVFIKEMRYIVPPDKKEITKVLDRPQNMAILKFIVDKDWVTAEQISDSLGINITLSMLYISDLEKVGLLNRQLETIDGERIFKFKLGDMQGLTLDELLDTKDSDITQDKVMEACGLYIKIYAALIRKLKEIGGRSMMETVIDRGMQDALNTEAGKLVQALEKGEDLETLITTFNKKIKDGQVKSSNFIDMKIEFTEFLKLLIEALEKFMGRLYGQHVTKTSLKPVLSDREDLIHELDLLAGLPKEYFPVRGG